MAYGQNQPWGLKAVKTINGATWNGQTSQYFIQSGYNFDIFQGDLVYLQNGFIHNLSELSLGFAYRTAQAIGVFNGCSYTSPTSVNPIDPASPGRQFWQANTQTADGNPATCEIIDDPNVIFNIQVAPGAIVVGNIGKTASVAYQVPGGNSQTGVSSLVLDTGQIDTNEDRNLRILRLVPDVNNAFGQNFNNVEVLIQHHSFTRRPAGL